MAGLGEADIAVTLLSEALRYIKDGFPVQVITCRPTAPRHVTAVGLAAGAPHAAEAGRFIDWLIDRRRPDSALYKNRFFLIPTNPESKLAKDYYTQKHEAVRIQDGAHPRTESQTAGQVGADGTLAHARRKGDILKAGFISLGCAKNLVDTEVMLGLLAAREIEITDDPGEAEFLSSIPVASSMPPRKNRSPPSCSRPNTSGRPLPRPDRRRLPRPALPAGTSRRAAGGRRCFGTGAWHRINEAIDAVLAGTRVVLAGETDTIYDHTMPRLRDNTGV